MQAEFYQLTDLYSAIEEETDPFSRTDYQYGLTDVPDDEGDLSRDLYALQT